MRTNRWPRVVPVVFVVGLLTIAAAGISFAPTASADSDKWADTCLDAEPLDPSDRPWGSFGENDRDVFLLELEPGQQATVEVTYTVASDANLVAFAVNQFIMGRDTEGSMGYFEVEESAHPKYYYDHTPVAAYTPNATYATQYREADSGDELNARHFVTGHLFEEGTHEFTITPETDDPVCLVLRTDTTGGGSWMLEYAEEQTEEDTSKEEQILTLRKTVEAQQTQIAELENSSTGATTGNASASAGNESADGESDDDGAPAPGQKTVLVSPAGGSSGLLGMDIPLLWVLGLLAIGVLLARKI